MADMIVSGAGTGSVNGTYTQTGTYDGRPYYNLSGTDPTQYSIVWADSSYWFITDSGGLENGRYYNADDVASPDLCTHPWDVGAADYPAPTVTAAGGGGTVSAINGTALASISAINGTAKASLSAINGQTL